MSVILILCSLCRRLYFHLIVYAIVCLRFGICHSLNFIRMDVLTDFTTIISELDLPAGVLAVLLDGMSAVEHRLAFGTDEKLQAASLVGVFVQARHMMKVA